MHPGSMRDAHPMSAKNSAEADPARKSTVWYLAAFSGPAISAYLLRGSRTGGRFLRFKKASCSTGGAKWVCCVRQQCIFQKVAHADGMDT